MTMTNAAAVTTSLGFEDKAFKIAADLLEVVPVKGSMISKAQDWSKSFIQSESKDPVATLPDNIVWDSSVSGSGSGVGNEVEAKADEPKIEATANEHEVEAKANEPEDEAKANEPKVEAKANEPEVEAKANEPEVEAKANEPEVETKANEPEVEAKANEPEVGANANEHEIEAKANVVQEKTKSVGSHVEAKADKPEIEAKPDTKPQIEAKDNEHNVEAKDDDADKPRVEVKAEPSTEAESTESTDAAPAMPKFNSVSEELKWKFNRARNSLKEAKQYVALAELIAAKKHRGTKNAQEVKNIITKTEVALVHAGEKMGLDYVHYKRSIEEDDYE
ncbi:hypothetical protein QZH41_002776 [Actinostola sp. cb2023]|nr:hypothetical protein QZH41_002776 [Actinostola sp. cb2023]